MAKLTCVVLSAIPANDERSIPKTTIAARTSLFPMTTIHTVIERWHAFLQGDLPEGLDGLLDDDVVFYSPIVRTPQEGKAVTRFTFRRQQQHSRATHQKEPHRATYVGAFVT